MDTTSTCRRCKKLFRYNDASGVRRMVCDPCTAPKPYAHTQKRVRVPRVYVVGNAANGLVKIGVTGELTRRMAGLATMSPVAIFLLWDVPGDYELERHLHAELAEYRRHGEWFEVGLEVVMATVARLMREDKADQRN